MLLDKYYTEKYLIFLDIEFQTFNLKGRQTSYILELGIIVFEKGMINPIFIDHVNFPVLPFENIRLIGHEYATVSKQTEDRLIDLENKFIVSPNLDDVKFKEKLIPLIPNATVKSVLKTALKDENKKILDDNKDLILKYSKKALYNLFYKRISKEDQIIFNTYMNLYKNDIDVMNRMTKPKEYLILLNNYLKNGLLVHKETMDIEAINNTSSYYKIPVKITKRSDIAIYNKDFDSLGVSPSLHKTYVYLYDNKISNDLDMLKYHNKLLDIITPKMGRFIPHNPLVDAFMTLFVFILMKK